MIEPITIRYRDNQPNAHVGATWVGSIVRTPYQIIGRFKGRAG
jgi:hypothetical protein